MTKADMMAELAYTKSPNYVTRSPAEAHCATCSCAPGMTPAVRFDTTPAERDGVVRDHLIRMGWTPPAEAQAQSGGEVVYQIENDPEEWFDVDRAMYEGHDGSRKRTLYTAPPSAPVGVEELMQLADKIENAVNHPSVSLDQVHMSARAVVCDAADQLRALAQQPAAEFTTPDCPRCGCVDDGMCLCQPAAVDGAMVERLALALAMYEQHRTTMQSLASSVGDFLRDYRALATQPGGSDNG